MHASVESIQYGRINRIYRKTNIFYKTAWSQTTQGSFNCDFSVISYLNLLLIRAFSDIFVNQLVSSVCTDVHGI